MNPLFRVLIVLIRIIDFCIEPIYWWLAKGKHVPVPPIDNPLLKISATELAAKIRKRQLQSETVCRAYIERIKVVNPIVNAVVEHRFESALKESQDVDNFLQTTTLSYEELEKSKPLLGVPLTIKESCSLNGLSLTVGVQERVGIKATTDSEVVALLKEGGAIPLLVSNIPEECLSYETRNYVTGVTKNPYNTSMTSGGSSGGEGALLSSGASVIGIGSDIGGSIRLPAMFNGIYGHKPSSGLISIKGHCPSPNDPNLVRYLAIGPMTRYACDLKLMTKVMANNKEQQRLYNNPVDLSQINVYYLEDTVKTITLGNAESEIKTAIKKAVSYLESNHECKIFNEVFDGMDDILETSSSNLFQINGLPYLLKADGQNLFVELIKSLFGYSKYTFNLLFFYTLQFFFNTFFLHSYYEEKNNKLKRTFEKKLGKNSVFICPSFLTSSFEHNRSWTKMSYVQFLAIFNSLGLPATNVPCGFNRKGLPIGFQVAAGLNQDHLCFAVAEALEKCFGGWIPPS